MKLETVTINPSFSPEACVIWLHGLGADGYNFSGIVPQLNLSPEKKVRFIFPHAPLRPVTLNGGYVMRAWFDLYGLNAGFKVDEKGIKAMQETINDLIQSQIDEGILANKILLAGFSQGGAMALYTGLHFSQRLGGILGLSTFLPDVATSQNDRSSANQNTPIMIAHGTQDGVVPMEWGKKTYQKLKDLHYPVSWHEYSMAHEVCWQEINDISQWIQKNIS